MSTPAASRIQEELERRILHGLSCEWEAAVADLDVAYRRMMVKPLFKIRSMKRKLGAWSGHLREICLSRDLVLNRPWDSVREVLRHEMAHQLARKLLGGREEPPHGPLFRRACLLLRADPRASGGYPTLEEVVSGAAEPGEDRILRRVKKLMALAGSGNAHEAEAALVKARELIARHNVDLLATAEPDFVSVFLGRPALRHRRETYALANLIQEHYFVAGIWIPAYVVEKGRMGRVLEISGTLDNVRLASYIHDFVSRFIGTQWADYNRDKRLTHHRRTDFALGVVDGFRIQLEARKGEVEAALGEKARDLVPMNDPRFQGYMAHRYPRTRSFRRGAASRDDGVRKDGKRVGEDLVIHEGVDESGNRRRLLTE